VVVESRLSVQFRIGVTTIKIEIHALDQCLVKIEKMKIIIYFFGGGQRLEYYYFSFFE
jgi:hypothetical protein